MRHRQSSASSGSAEEARVRLPDSSNSTTPGASGKVAGDWQASTTRPRRIALANRDEVGAMSATSLSLNSGSPARRTTMRAPHVVPSATNAARNSGPMPAGVNRSRNRSLRSG